MNLTIGSDPEVMLRNNLGDLVPAANKFRGTKRKPFKLTDKIAMQVDNVNLEFNTTPTTKDTDWVNQHKEALDLLAEYAQLSEYEIAIQPAGVFDPQYMTHPSVFVFGCEPDYNIWTGEMQMNPSHPNEMFRSAGGHIHLGTDVGMSSGEQHLTAIFAELFIGVWLTQYETEDDLERRKLYGRSGSIRFKPYGIEYRSPGNCWLKDSGVMLETFVRAQRVAELAVITQASEIPTYIARYKDLCTRAINEHDADAINEIESIVAKIGL